jgi:fimbrial chaperone protein
MDVSPESRSNGGRFYWLTVMAVGCLLTNAALAVTITPVKVELSHAHSVVTITVTNDADLPLTLQQQVLAWTQVDGEDHLEESTDLLVAPAIAKIEPRGIQIFRVTQRRPTVAVAERAYRLVLDDVSAIERQGEVSGVNVFFSHRLPVFVAGTGKIGPKLHLAKCPNSAELGCVRLENDGDQYVQVRSLIVNGRTWQEELEAGNRILAGAWRQWTFASPPVSAGRLTITAETSAGQMSFEFPNSGL